MSKKKRNSIDTENPFDLLQQIQIVYKNDKKLRVGFYVTEYECTGKNRFEIKKFEVIRPKINEDSDHDVVNVLEKVRRFAMMCKNPIEVATLIIDTYKLNRDIFTLGIVSRPTHRDAVDSSFIRDILLNG